MFHHEQDLNVNLSGNKPILMICTSHDSFADGTPTGAWCVAECMNYIVLMMHGQKHHCSWPLPSVGYRN